MNVLDLFSGIGGFSLGLERAGMRTLAFCEIDPYACAVLRKHWPDVPCSNDVRTLTKRSLWRDGVTDIDVICGGFPCQDISLAGAGAGMEGERSGLWSEYARIISELRPRFVIVENVSALLGRGLDRVLGDLSTLGYDAEWHCIPASAIGAPHRRDRIWIVAYPERLWGRQSGGSLSQTREPLHPTIGQESSSRLGSSGKTLANAEGDGWREGQQVSDARSNPPCRERQGKSGGIRPDVADPARQLLDWSGSPGAGWRRQFADSSWWSIEPNVGRVAHGVPHRTHRLKGLGNAVVPQIPEIIGRAIMRANA